MNRILALALLFLAVLAAPAARADEARNQFNEGMRLLAKGDYQGSCTAFEKSEAAGKPTMATRYQLGRCNEGREKYGKAYVAYQSAAALADKGGDPERATIARQRAQEVASKAPKIALVVPADRDVDGMRIRLDGEPVGREDWGRALPVAEGAHRVVVEAPKRTSATIQLNAPEGGEVAKIEIPKLAPAGTSPEPAPSATPSPAPGAAPQGPNSYYDRTAAPPMGGPEMKRKNNGLFWTGVALVIAGGVTGIIGAIRVGIDAGSDVPPGPDGIGMVVVGGVFLSVGIPFMAVFGRKVPAEPEQPEAKEKAGPTVEPLIAPTGGGLRVRF